MARPTGNKPKANTTKANSTTQQNSTTSGTTLTAAQRKTHTSKVQAQQAKVLAAIMPIAAKQGHSVNYSVPLARVYVKHPQGFNPWVYCTALTQQGVPPVQVMYRARKQRLTIVVPGAYPTT